MCRLSMVGFLIEWRRESVYIRRDKESPRKFVRCSIIGNLLVVTSGRKPVPPTHSDQKWVPGARACTRVERGSSAFKSKLVAREIARGTSPPPLLHNVYQHCNLDSFERRHGSAAHPRRTIAPSASKRRWKSAAFLILRTFYVRMI